MTQAKQRIILSMVLLALLGVVILALVLKDDTQHPLKEALSAPECSRSCWWGIEPDVTKYGTVLNILIDAGIQDATNAVGGYGTLSGLVSWMSDGDWMIDNYYVTVVIDDGIVTQVYVPLKPLCVSTVVEAYGLPTKVERDFGENRHRLIYAEEKLAFASDWKDPTRISGVYLVSERGFDEWLQTSSHMEDWEDMSEVFAGECHDNLSGQAVP